MARFCTNCGKELDENAAICLNCGVIVGNTTQNSSTSNIGNTNNGKKEKKGLPTWAIVLIVVGCVILIPVIIFIAFAVFVYNVVSDSDSDYDYNFDDYIEETITQKGTIGDTLVTDNFKITLTDALIYSSIGEESYYVDKPAEGKEYLVFFLDVENTSNESQYISSYYFDGYVDGYNVSETYLFNDVDGTKELGTTLAAGKKTNGFVAFEVDTTWREFELNYRELFGEEELIFTVVNEDSSNVENENNSDIAGA